MPSKYVAKAFVRDEISQATGALRAELVRSFDDTLARLEDAHSLQQVPNSSAEDHRLLISHTATLGMLVEMALRRIIALDKGEEWVKGVEIFSAMDVLMFMSSKLRQTEEQEAVAVTIIAGLLETPV